MPFKDTIKLGFGYNLIMGNCPDVLPLEKVAQKTIEEHREIESYGLFDSNQANYNTYYPDLNIEDLTPKDGEFIQPVFRALSEVIVHKEINPVDFSEKGVLRKSMPLLEGASINADHETTIGNAMGAVSKVSWQDSYKTDKGILIPAGINAKLKIDGKSHPRVARAIMMDPPAIHSTSVTVQFLWDMSHNLSQQDFFAKLGTFDKDGKMIRRVASDIKRYHEISLVSHGADPYAQKIQSTGDINNPIWADVSYNSANPKERKASKYFFFDLKSDLISNTENISIPPTINNNNTSQTSDMNKQFLLALAMVYGLQNKVGDKTEAYTEDTITEEVITNHAAAQTTSLNNLKARPDITSEEVTRLKEVETKYNAIKDQTGLKEFMDNQTTKLREATLKNYNLLANGKPQEVVTKLIEKGSYDVLEALNSQYTSQLESAYPVKCKKCGSTEVNRASASQDSGKGDNANDQQQELSMEEIQGQIRKERTNSALHSMHGEDK